MSVLGRMREPSGAYWISGSLLTAVSMICTPRNTVDNASGSCDVDNRGGNVGASASSTSSVVCAARSNRAAVLEMREMKLMRPIQPPAGAPRRNRRIRTSQNV